VDPDVLVTISDACHRRERLRFDYTSHHGTRSLRQVEPHALVSWGRHWYLVAWDTDRDAWRSFRVDQLRPRTPGGSRFPWIQGDRCGLGCAAPSWCRFALIDS
jgi:predicted DNA-binding transcriptional regulator YafY